MEPKNSVDITPYVIPNIAEAVLSDYKISLVYGWRDGGKSTTVFNVAIWKCLLEPHYRCAHCRAKYNEIAGSTFQTLCDQIKKMKLDDYFIITKDRFKITNKHNPNNFFFGASGDQPDKIRSTANLSHIILDEMHSATIKDFESLVGTLREQEGVTTKFIGIFNNDKVSEKSWIYEKFFDINSPIYNQVERVLCSYENNPYVNQIETKKKLMLIAMNDERRFNSLVAGEFVQEQNDNPFFFAYEENKFIGECFFMPNFELILSFDFNINPATCTAWQYSVGDFIHCIKAYREPNCTLEDLCKKILVDFPNALFRVTGDPSGRARFAGAKSPNENLYTIIKTQLGISSMQIDQPEINYANEGYWRETRIMCNLVLQNHPNFIMNEATTKDLRYELEIAKPEEGKDKLYKTAGPTEYGMNLVDTFMYFMLTYMNDYLKR
jgi:Phage terminase large subunit